MIGVALKGLLARKVRALLTAFAIVIGVSMVSGTFVLTDTMQKAFDGIFTASYDETDAVIAGKQIVEGSTSGGAAVPESLLAQGAGAAGGRRGRRHDGDRRVQQGRDHRPRRQAGWVGRRPQARARQRHLAAAVQPAEAQRRRMGTRPEQVVIDAATAEKERYAVGDSIAVSTLGDKQRYELTGIATFGDVDSLGGATMAVFDIDTAQTLLHKEGEFDGISIAAREGTSSEELVKAVQPLVPASLELKDAKAQAEADSAEINEALASSATSCWASAASRCSSARSSSSTRSRSRSPSARASSRRCARSAARASRSCARSSSRAS